MRQLDPEHVAVVLETINRAPFFRHLSMSVRELGAGFSVVELEVGPELMNPFGAPHGGVYASAIDTAAYWAVYGDLDEGVGFTSVDLRVDFLAPSRGGTIIVRGSRIKTGRTICLAEATAFDRENRCLAHGVSKMLVSQGLQTIGQAIELDGASRPLPPKFSAQRDSPTS